MVIRARRGMVLSLLGMAGLRGRLGPRTVLSISSFSVVERVLLRSPIAQREYIVKSSALPMRREGAALYWVGEHVVSAARLLASERHARGEWIAMSYAPHEWVDPSDEATLTQMAERAALFHSLTLGYPFRELPLYDAPFWEAHLPTLLRRLQRLGTLPPAEIEPDLHRMLNRTLRELIAALAAVPRDHFALVHGSLHVGHVVRTERGAQALDWGRAHINLPILDLAHMLASARLSNTAKQRVVARYLKLLDIPLTMPAADLLRVGRQLHHLYALEWQSRTLLVGAVPEPLLGRSLHLHLHALANA